VADPITTIHDFAWSVVDAEIASDVIKPGNRIRFTDRDELKSSIQDSDLPELILQPRSSIGNLTSTSSAVSMDLTFDWLMTTGDYRVSYRLYPVLWELFKAMSVLQRTINTLQHNSQKFVVGAFFDSNSIGESDPERNRGIRGFSTVLSFTVRCKFNKDNL
jgi:hypothetical protein